MATLLFEQLENAGFIKNNSVVISKIQSTPVTKLMDIARESEEITSVTNLDRENSIFSFTVSLSLGAGRIPCSSLECRLKQAEQLAQFAGLYSDKIFIDNFLAELSTGFDDDVSEEHYKESFYNDLIILRKLRPLIKSERIVVIAPQVHCPHCLMEYKFGKDSDKRYSKELKNLRQQFINTLKAEVEFISPNYGIYFNCPEKLFEHGGGGFILSNPPQLDSKILSKIETGLRVSLTKTSIRKIGLDNRLAEYILANVRFELATSQNLNASFLTERPIHIEILNSLSGDPVLYENNNIVYKNLTSLVPFINDVDTKDLLKIREREEESFVLFRNGLNKAIDEYKKSNKTINERAAKAIYAEFIAPALAQLDLKIRSAKRGLIKGTRRDVTSWVGAISFGLFAGFLTGDIINAAKVLGFTKIVADLTERVMGASDYEESIRNDSMYFLWKVREKANKHA